MDTRLNDSPSFLETHFVNIHDVLPEEEEEENETTNITRKAEVASKNGLKLEKERGLKGESGIDIQENDDVSGSGGVDDDEFVNKNVPVGWYSAALRGPELDRVKAVIWRALSTSPSTKFLHITPMINFALWLLAFGVLVAISVTYALKCAFYFEAVKREYYHPVRVNFLFAPWVVFMFLAIGAPSRIAPQTLHAAIWCVSVAPILFLELKIYGQWLSGGKQRL
ncbi:hypothetical protein ACH5RR_041466 [Cinchona calisaya]|uniref:Uncharacterized protein n=1 Tax=Cinchona calisaya TaxID=153742 RepID=A0ABD2XTS1_9GENT